MTEICVIIPTYNRAERLRSCLESLERQTQPMRDFEVVVVIDGSSDITLDVLATYEPPYSLQVIVQANQGANVARNHGVSAARSRYCLFIDDDIIADPSLVATHLRLQRAHVRAVGIGQIIFALDDQRDWFTSKFAAGWEDHYRRLNQGDDEPSWMDCYGGNLSMPRQIFGEVGGFATDLRRSHDIELAYRLSQIGVEFIYVPEAIGHQDDRKDVTDLAADAQNFGAAWIALCRKHPILLPQVLGALVDTSFREKALRRIVWALHLTPTQLNVLGSLLDTNLPGQKWYRFIHKYFYWRGLQRALPKRKVWRSWTRGTTILMYHAFSAAGEPPGRFNVPIWRFTEQMEWLKRLGYHGVSVEEYLRLQRENRLPRRTVVITIDDGYADVYTLAYPVLRHYGFSATLFIVSGRIGTHNDWSSHPELQGRPLLSWSQIAEMQENGLYIGSHTCTHPRLSALSVGRAAEELRGARLDIEGRIQSAVETLAYPYGDFDAATQTLAERAGYLASCGTESGQNRMVTPLHALRRTEVDGRQSLFHFLLGVWTGMSANAFGPMHVLRWPYDRQKSGMTVVKRQQSR